MFSPSLSSFLLFSQPQTQVWINIVTILGGVHSSPMNINFLGARKDKASHKASSRKRRKWLCYQHPREDRFIHRAELGNLR